MEPHFSFPKQERVAPYVRLLLRCAGHGLRAMTAVAAVYANNEALRACVDGAVLRTIISALSGSRDRAEPRLRAHYIAFLRDLCDGEGPEFDKNRRAVLLLLYPPLAATLDSGQSKSEIPVQMAPEGVLMLFRSEEGRLYRAELATAVRARAVKHGRVDLEGLRAYYVELVGLLRKLAGQKSLEARLALRAILAPEQVAEALQSEDTPPAALPDLVGFFCDVHIRGAEGSASAALVAASNVVLLRLAALVKELSMDQPFLSSTGSATLADCDVAAISLRLYGEEAARLIAALLNNDQLAHAVRLDSVQWAALECILRPMAAWLEAPAILPPRAKSLCAVALRAATLRGLAEFSSHPRRSIGLHFCPLPKSSPTLLRDGRQKVQLPNDSQHFGALLTSFALALLDILDPVSMDDKGGDTGWLGFSAR